MGFNFLHCLASLDLPYAKLCAFSFCLSLYLLWFKLIFGAKCFKLFQILFLFVMYSLP